MSPFQHGEVFVTEDGAETDLDLGHYERFIDEDLNQFSNLTTGKVYWNVLNKERAGEYLGETVQVIPHITGEIKSFIYAVGKKTNADVVITEIRRHDRRHRIPAFPGGYPSGGRRGRAAHLPVPACDARAIHLGLGRSQNPSLPSTRSRNCAAWASSPISSSAALTVHWMRISRLKFRCSAMSHPTASLKTARCPSCIAHRSCWSAAICPISSAGNSASTRPAPDLGEWTGMLARMDARQGRVKIALVGKYVKLHDAYLSVAEALHHAGYEVGCFVDIDWVDSETINDQTVGQLLAGADGIILPGGFGARGIPGMLCAANYARVHSIPYFGICLGMQIAVMSYARSVLGWADANSAEFDPDTTHPVIALMDEQHEVTQKGGTMRLGAYPCRILPESVLSRAYAAYEVRERHRHRYEFNNTFRTQLETAGLRVTGVSPNGKLVEAVEIPTHPFYIGVQFHPEFKSRPNHAHPLFRAFVAAAERRNQNHAD